VAVAGHRYWQVLHVAVGVPQIRSGARRISGAVLRRCRSAGPISGAEQRRCRSAAVPVSGADQRCRLCGGADQRGRSEVPTCGAAQQAEPLNRLRTLSRTCVNLCIGQLMELHELQFGGNRQATLPESIGQPTTLRGLRLWQFHGVHLGRTLGAFLGRTPGAATEGAPGTPGRRVLSRGWAGARPQRPRRPAKP